MKDMKNSPEKVLINLLIFTVYSFVWFRLSTIIEILGVDLSNLSDNAKTLYSLIIELFITLILFIINYKTLSLCFKDYKKNYSKYISTSLKYWLIGIGMSLICNAIIVDIFKISTSDNQAAINSMLRTNPIYVILSAVIIAPICEELIFRQSFKKMFESKNLYIIMSGLAFGLFHVINISSSWAGFTFALSYAVLGSTFAYILTKTNNVLVPISFHAVHNALILLLQIIVLLVK